MKRRGVWFAVALMGVMAGAIVVRGAAGTQAAGGVDVSAGWEALQSGEAEGSMGQVGAETAEPMLEMTVTKTAGPLMGRVGAMNRIHLRVEAGRFYDIAFSGRADKASVGLVFSLETADGKVLARTTLPEIGRANRGTAASSEWLQYLVSLHAQATDGDAVLTVTPIEPTHIVLKHLMLTPRAGVGSDTGEVAGQVPAEPSHSASPLPATLPAPTAAAVVRTGAGEASAADVEFLRQYGNTGTRVHDPSTIIQDKDEFWVFCTGLNTPAFHSKDLRHWERGKPVNTQDHAWIKEVIPTGHDRNYWAPDIIKVRDKYLLFFSASAFGKNTSGIGVMANPTLDQNDPAYHWTDNGLVVASRTEDDFNTIDPAPILDKDGRLWLAFGSFWSGIKLVELNPETGGRIAPDSPMYAIAHWDSIEGSYIYQHEGYYYLFASYGLCCRGAASTYHTRVGRATKMTGPYLDKVGNDLLLGGGTPFTGTDGIFIGPGHAGIIEVDGKYWFSCHFYDGSGRGQSKLAVRPLTWGADGWPVVGKVE